MSDLSWQHEDVFEEGGLQKRQDELLAITRELFDDQDLITLRLILNNQHESDLADLLAQLPEDDQPLAFDLIAAPLAANTLTEIETPTLLTLLEHLDMRVHPVLIDMFPVSVILIVITPIFQAWRVEAHVLYHFL
mgnify:CR=1 FL=1